MSATLPARADPVERAAFIAGNYADVFRANLDGTGLTQLTHCKTNENDCIFYWPALSPDGQVIALESGHCCITLMSIDGSLRRVLINEPVHEAYFPAWAPDGKHVLFSRKGGGSVGVALWSISTETGALAEVVSRAGYSETGDYSPDGKLVVYEYKAGAGEPNQVFVRNIEKGSDTQLAGGQFNTAQEPHFSPDGTKVAFIAKTTSESHRYLYEINADGTGLRQLTSDSANYFSPTWKKDGSQILVNREPKPSECKPEHLEHIGWISATSENPSFTALVQPPYPAEYECGENIGSTRKPSAWAFTTEQLSPLWGGPENPSAPNRPCPTCGEPVIAATGDYFEKQTDFSVGGRGVGLRLARTYNSQAGAAGIKGAFGYGWSSSFSDSLSLETNKATLHQANGSTVPFTEAGGSFSAPAWSQDKLSGSKETGYTLTYPNQTQYRFSGTTGRLENVTDRNGNATTLSYNEAGRLTMVTDPAGRKLTLTYNAEGLVEKAEDPMKHVVKYTYEAGNLASVTLPGEASARWSFKYDGSRQLTELTDGRGGKTLNEYNGAHQAIKQTDPLKRELSLEYEPLHTKITIKATGAVTDERFNGSFEPVAITRGYGTAIASTESFSYDFSGNLLSATDGNKHTTKYGYDSEGNRTSRVDANEHETKWGFDATHDVTSVTTPKGEKTTIKRDSHGNPEAIERPAPGETTQTTKYKYGAHGELESVEDPLKRVWTYEYDSQGDRTAEIDPEKDKRTFKYDEDSSETSSVSPRGNVEGAEAAKYTTKVERDERERPLKVTDPLGHTTKYKYDGDGNLETLTDANNHTTTYTYDAANDQTKVKAPNGITTETEYDGEGHLTAQIDGNKHKTTYTRNILGQVKEVEDPLKHKTTKEYDAAGNLEKLTDAAKRTTTYKYDAANRLTEVSYSDGKTHSVKYEYDADGDRTKMEDATGTSKYAYDQLDRLTESEDGHKDLVKYEYDLANQQAKITYPNGKAVSRVFDNAGRLEKVTDWSEHTTKFGYDPDSELKATTWPSGTSGEDKYTYNEADQLTKTEMNKGAESLASLTYARDNDGQLESTTQKGLPGEEKTSYSYDENHRLTKGGTTEYKYDEGDNPTKLGAIKQTFNEGDQLAEAKQLIEGVEVPFASYSYDSLGERTKTAPAVGTATAYGYDQAGDLTSVERTLPAIADSYAYDGNGLRASQTISGTPSYFAWDVSGSLPLLLNDGMNSYIYGPEGAPIEQISVGATVTYLHHDQQGSTRLLTGSTGAVEGKCSYGVYGAPTCEGSAATSLGYDGQYTNSDTGLQYLRARSYDSATGQFTSVDPIAPLTRAPYSFAGDNPLAYSDPFGLDFGEEFEGFGQGALEVVSTPGELAAEGIDEAASLTGVPEAAERAAQFWARVATSKCSSGGERLLANIFGPLSELATRKNIGATALTLLTVGGPYVAADRLGYTGGREFVINEDLRVSPFGNSNAETWPARLPHYHRRITDEFGNTVPGGSLNNWHRPWQKGF